MDLAQLQQYLTGPLVSNWMSRCRQAETSKLRFTTIAKMCRQFFGSSAEAMWERSFRETFFPKAQEPLFKVNLNKAFELVAVIGPSLYWSNPSRRVESYEPLDQAKAAMALGIMDEQVMQQLQQMQQMQQMQNDVRNDVASMYLAYSQQEQQGTLKADCHMAIDESLLTGLGLMWTQTYTHLGTSETLTRNRYGSVDELLIDPDSRDPEWRDAKWIARRHFDPIWEVERLFGYPPGYLAGRGTNVSAEHEAIREKQDARYADMMEWTEVWSVAGVGARIGGVDPKISQFLDDVAGKHVYMCVTPNVPHPLNLPPQLLSDGTVEDVRQALKWRCSGYGAVHEVWKDERWPCTPLKHYRVPGSPWPMAVLAPGLGYLIAMNLIMCTKLEMSWERRRDIIAVAKSVQDNVTIALKQDVSPAIIPISAGIDKPLNELVQYLQRPASADDLLQWMEYLSGEFAKATGLLDLYYGITRTQSRVSSDVQMKQQAANVRPEQMMENVVQWVKDFSTSELWLAAKNVRGEQLAYLVGQYGAVIWDAMIASMPVELLAKECECFIDPKDLKRPDKSRDLDALQMLAPNFFVASLEYAKVTGDTDPWNAFIRRMTEAMDMRDTEDLMFKPMTPPADPFMQEQQQRMVKLEADRLEAEVGETQAKTYGRATDTLYKQQGITPQMIQKLTGDEEKHRQQLRQDEENHLQELLQKGEMFALELKKLREKPKPAASKA